MDEEIYTFIAADAKFFDEAAARKQGVSIDRYNEFVINSINQIIKSNENHIIFNGEISKGSKEETKEIMGQIYGIKSIIDYKYQKQFTPEEWKEIGFTHVWDTSGAITCKIMEKDSYVILETDKEMINRDLALPNCYLAAPESMIDTGEIYKNKVLNISLNKWHFQPIEIGERLPQIIDDKELFMSMEDTF